MKRYSIPSRTYISTDVLSPVKRASEMFSTIFEPRFLQKNKCYVYLAGVTYRYKHIRLQFIQTGVNEEIIWYLSQIVVLKSPTE